MVFRHDMAKPSEVTIGVDNYPNRVGLLIKKENAVYIVDSDAENHASSMTILAVNEKNANELIAARSTITLIGLSDTQPETLTAKGICKIER
jgi:hypothetical protein